MRWSFRIARLLGIEVRIHLTFLLLLAFLALDGYNRSGMAGATSSVAFVCLVFLCVLLHEFGHALAARRYGIATPDITLLPIGGVARLERMPEKPGQELIVAVAGPLVNVVIALLLGIFLEIRGDFPNPAFINESRAGLPMRLLAVNVMLIVFNMIPAFPMDGGRVLRAFLAMRMDYARATHIAATIGQVCACAFGMLGLLQAQPLLVFVAVFIFFGAGSEAAHANLKSASAGLRVHHGMITHFQALPQGATLNEAIEALLRTSQHDFPVLGETGDVRGLLTRDDLIVALGKTGPDTPVATVMRFGVPLVHHTMLFDQAYNLMQESGFPALPVVDSKDRLIGLFTPENVGELMMVRNALAKSRPKVVNTGRAWLPAVHES